MSTRITFQGLERAPGLIIKVFVDGAVNCTVPEPSISRAEYERQRQLDGALVVGEDGSKPSQG